MQLYLREGRQERPCCIGHQWAMEGSCNRQSLAGEFMRSKGCCCPLNLQAAAGEDGLAGRVPVCNYQVQLLLRNDLFNRCKWCRNSQHPPLVASAGCHEPAAESGKLKE